MCPEEECFYWRQPGDEVNLDQIQFKTVQEAEGKLYKVEFEGCHCPFGQCSRLHPDAEHDRFFERPNRPVNG